MRIRDWSSDVCSSDLLVRDAKRNMRHGMSHVQEEGFFLISSDKVASPFRITGGKRGLVVQCLDQVHGFISFDKRKLDNTRFPAIRKIGRASCRERVCQYV